MEYSPIINLMEFSEWITDRFIDWRGSRYGKGSSIAEFAKQFHVSQQLMSEWMKKGGPIPKHQKYINSLAEVFGPEVYDVLNLPRPDPLYGLPGKTRERLNHAIGEIKAEYAARKIDPESAEAERIAEDVFRRHGFIVTEIQPDDEGS